MKKNSLAMTVASVALLALPANTVVGVSAAMAMEPAGDSFCPAGTNNVELARKFDASLAIDPTGNRQLEACNATPLDYLAAFQQVDPDEGLTHVNQLAAYARKWVPAEVDRTLEYQSSCLRYPAGGGRVIDLGCVTRSLRPGEIIYMNPDTQVKVMWSGCANPGFAPSLELTITAEDCLVVRVPRELGIPVGSRVNLGYIDSRLLPGRCHALRLPGDEETIFDFPEECPMNTVRVRQGRMVEIICNWDDVERNTSRVRGRSVQIQNVSASFVIREADGFDWYLPLEARNGDAAICIETPDGRIISFSVHGPNYGEDGEYVVTAEDIRLNTHRAP